MGYTVVIPAAGIGKRMGAGKNKLLLSINEIPVLVHTLKVFEQDDWCQSIVLAVNDADRKDIHTFISRYSLKKIKTMVKGGKERQHSVYAGLQSIQEETIVLIHDGARPFIKQSHIHQLVEAAKAHGAAILAVPVKDTVKKVENGYVQGTINRDTLWSIQTPQAFSLALIKHAHIMAEQDQFIGTDDASLVERLGEKVIIVEGDYDNIKITTKEDLYFAQAILSKEMR
ncbi:2-C-methyl-D-erythritol 4-phosphate cytidylyltransferase [Caldibacillus lycopersici]|uniref:2-C-methyl-D-erythritol 4-phosphate cytidylyltransferase n=1 Tax=Perspicuibacillus lycopersici TaxID=1325689 RepID=A0AAE3IYH1_9BACI|nr:2-C-methyl-D-erythritol 4-phosphate cytidylyltransferase [Perspicuibacillus lycopersici]MCU9615254.1 2-C-methyl-D-erythritol 4-phosphate cytidylyltransferase [Perspicuibacillus lycopersici]